MIVRMQLITLTALAAATFAASTICSTTSDNLRGTIVVAVPVRDGLVVCSDKRLYNDQSGRYTDDSVKIRKINDTALFVATNTIGFYDSRSRSMAFNAFDVTERFVAMRSPSEGRAFWDGLKKEINARLREYFAKRSYAEWPESDRASNNLLFNLIFYTTTDGKSYSYTLRVFYEKARTPIITIADPIREEIRTTKLAGKGRDVIGFLARTPTLASDGLIQRFGNPGFDRQTASTTDATAFAKKLIVFTSRGVPAANVSPTSDCAHLGYESGFKWIN